MQTILIILSVFCLLLAVAAVVFALSKSELVKCAQDIAMLDKFYNDLVVRKLGFRLSKNTKRLHDVYRFRNDFLGYMCNEIMEDAYAYYELKESLRASQQGQDEGGDSNKGCQDDGK